MFATSRRDRFKVFIIDEAHQITNEAFNALLKTIEEPPEWAVFILCTTESHKIPATIASRCQHFSFQSVDFEELIARLRWICEQENVTFEEEALAILARSGEGSVRDSLSALDQAIACSGSKLEAAQVRETVGAFSMDAFRRVAAALSGSDPGPMLDLADELERHGQNLQHFARELCRYFRNLLVSKVSGENTRLVAASAPERAALATTAREFTEEDLTRYLQLSLDLYKDIQVSLQPRFHLELGLLRLVHAARLVPIERALADFAPAQDRLAQPSPRSASLPVSATPLQAVPPARRGPSPFEADRLRKAGVNDPQNSALPSTALSGANALATAREVQSPPLLRPTETNQGIDWRKQLMDGLTSLGLTFTADALNHAEIEQHGGELVVRMPSEFKMVARAEEFQKAVKHLQLAPVRFKLVFDDSSMGNPAQPPNTPARSAVPTEDEITRRALAHPEVQRFREVFGGEVRGVRNLKE